MLILLIQAIQFNEFNYKPSGSIVTSRTLGLHILEPLGGFKGTLY